MPMSLFQVYAHLTFRTRDRIRWLEDSVRERVHGYLAATGRDMGAPFVVVGGPDDHVHMLLLLPKQKPPVDLVAHVKRESSKFVKTLGRGFGDFAWQRGYGMFSVGPSHIGAVESYIRGQEEHHRRVSFQDEFRAFLKKYDVAYDERYVWD